MQEKITCAILNLEKAIELHDLHIEHPTTATDTSQKELKKYIIDAYKCLDGKSRTHKIKITKR